MMELLPKQDGEFLLRLHRALLLDVDLLVIQQTGRELCALAEPKQPPPTAPEPLSAFV
jgi:hypothetical protein